MLETRFVEFNEVEFRDNDREVSGYAILFNEPSVTLGGSNGFQEIISKRALDNVDLKDVYLLNQHKSDEVLGSTKSETMQLTVTDKGLHFRAQLPNTTLGRDTYELVKRGDLKSMSFGMKVSKDSWNMNKIPEVRTVDSISNLAEVSLVTFPAYEQSSVSTRSREVLDECRECRNITVTKNETSNKLLDEAKELLNSIQG